MSWRKLLIGVRHATEQIRKCGKDTCAVGFEIIESVERLTQRRELRRLRCV
jgi:hypothetical protein